MLSRRLAFALGLLKKWLERFCFKAPALCGCGFTFDFVMNDHAAFAG
jgi:hypothetical protein